MTNVHIHVEGREALAVLLKLLELESESVKDRAKAKELTAKLEEGSKALYTALEQGTPQPTQP